MNTLIFDVGKTHIKLHLVDAHWNTVFSSETTNHVVKQAPYPHFNIEGIWQWLLEGMRAAASQFTISAISITTHGATAALIDRSRDDHGLVLPVLDYEHAGPTESNAAYAAVRPAFAETFSPDLPLGLNLGRQLFWQQTQFNQAFQQATDILLYPQYWAWRLSGICCAEVTSLGCHTDLWATQRQDFSTLVDQQGWRKLFPPLVPAWTDLGSIKPAIAAQTGVAPDCRVIAGIHDSNASFLRYKKHYGEQPFTVITTGTWSIVMASGVALGKLQPGQDMLANVDATGQPVVCSRSMGGREFESICKLVGTGNDEMVSESVLQKLIDTDVMALPNFSHGSGPFQRREGEIIGSAPEKSGAALASLYCALMLDYQLDLVDARGDVFIEGAFLKNHLLCGILAQLRSRKQQQLWLSSDTTGTVQGCAQLARWHEPSPNLSLIPCKATTLAGLARYKERWRTRATS